MVHHLPDEEWHGLRSSLLAHEEGIQGRDKIWQKPGEQMSWAKRYKGKEQRTEKEGRVGTTYRQIDRGMQEKNAPTKLLHPTKKVDGKCFLYKQIQVTKVNGTLSIGHCLAPHRNLS